MADAVFDLIDDVKHLLDIVVHEGLGVMGFVIRIAELDIADGHILRTRSDGGFFEKIDVIIILILQIIIADSADKNIVLLL